MLAGQAPAPVLPAMVGPVEQEQRRAVTRQRTHPAIWCAGRANIAYTRRALRNHTDAFAVYGI